MRISATSGLQNKLQELLMRHRVYLEGMHWTRAT